VVATEELFCRKVVIAVEVCMYVCYMCIHVYVL